MPYTKPTFVDLQLSFADRYGAGSTAELSNLTQVKRFLNRGVAYAVRKLKLTLTQTVIVTGGVGTLPIDFQGVYKVFINDAEVQQLNGDNDPQGYGYWIDGNQLSGFTLNSKNDGDYSVVYTFLPAKMVNDTDVCIIPDEEAISAYAYGMIRKSETDPLNDADKALAECNSRLSELIDIQDLNSQPQGFSLPNNA